jgi:ASPIC and UnbV/FG-GAP-like repeat
LGIPMQPMGSNFGDLDNDGYLDFYLGTGDPSYSTIVPNLMFLNRAGQRFADISVAGGFAQLQKGHAVAFADLDNDGDLDVFEKMGGAYPGDAFSDALYENPGMGNNWITVQLVGRQSNRSAIGARIRVQVEENGVTRSIYRHVNSGGSFGANPLRQTIGLGKVRGAQLLEIFWPRTGKTQTVINPPPAQFIQVVEGVEGYTKLSLKRFKF